MFEIAEYIKIFFDLDNSTLRKKWEDVFDQMAVHTRKKKPEELLLKQRPNETPEILQYRLCNYRAITYGSMNRATDSVGRILNKTNYYVNADDKTKEYLKTRNFFNYDFYSFLEKIVFKRDIEDPNGFLVWLPSGKGLTDSSQRVEPKPFLYYSFQLHDSTPDVISFITDEKSEIRKGNKTVKEGLVYLVITKDSYYRLVQIGDAKHKEFELQLIYKHNLGEIPVVVLGGDMNAEGFFESYFAPYVAFGDEAISTFSDWQAIKVTSGFPYREEFYTECEIKHVNKSSNDPNVGEQKYEADTIAKPMGKSPYGAIIRKIPGNPQDNTLLGERVLAVDVPSIRFISADVEVAKYSGESWEKLIELAEDSLHLNLTTGVNQSGVAKDRDLEQERAMIDKIGNNFFDNIMLYSVKFIEALLMNKSYEKTEVSINKPSTFRIKTEVELVEELGTLKEKNVPSLFLAQATIELANKRFNGSPVAKKIFHAISIIDPLYIYDVAQKNQMELQGDITKEANIRSIYVYSLLLKIVDDISPEKFITLTVQQISELFDKEIEPYLPEETPPTFDAEGNQI